MWQRDAFVDQDGRAGRGGTVGRRNGGGRRGWAARGRAAAGAVTLLALLSGFGPVGRVSVSNSGVPAEYITPSFTPVSISADGRWIAFDSLAENLVAGAEGGVFVRDTWGNTTAAVSVRANGTVDDLADTPAISADGRFVAFVSDDAQLVPGGNGNFYQVFLRDRTLGQTTRVSVKPAGTQGTDDSGHPSVSSDGRYIAFESDSPGLVTGDNNDWTDVFVRDRVAGTTQRVSVYPNGAQADQGGDAPSISADGRMVAFVSSEAMVAGDTNNQPDVYVRDRVANTTTLASVRTTGTIPNGAGNNPAISANGRYVAFLSVATDMDGTADTDNADVFVRDLVAGTTHRVTHSASGGAASSPSISGDGRYVSFESSAADAAAGDTNGVPDAFLYDRTLATTQRVSTNQDGSQLAQGGTRPVISADGQTVAFGSTASITGLSVASVGQLYARVVGAAPLPEISIGNATVVEGNLRSRQLRFTVTLSRPSTGAVGVAYETAAGSAAAGTDFVAKSSALIIPPGSTSAVVTVDVKGDRVDETNEAFTVKLTNPAGATRRKSSGTGTIVDDDGPSTNAVRISIGHAALVEGNSGARGLRFPVTLSQSSPNPVSVWYATSTGTAKAADFAAKSGIVTIPARATSTVINISVKPDYVLERTETFTVTLLSPTGATIHRASATGSILDDG
jgi:Tol biopolymer transport system component